MRPGSSVLLVSVAALAIGCSALSRSPAPTPDRSRIDPARNAKSAEASGPALTAHALTELREGTLGPFLGTNAGGRLVVWVEPGSAGGFYARALDRAGEPSGAARQLGPARDQAGLIAVRPGPDGGYLVLASRRADGGEDIALQRVSATGRIAGAAVTVVEGAARLFWMDALPSGEGVVLLWAEAVDGAARIQSRALDAAGVPRSAARELVRRALAWQAAALPAGIALGFVEANKGGGRGPVALQIADGDGAPKGRPVPVSPSPTAMPDLDLAVIGDAVALAWSDTRGEDPAVYLAVVDGANHLSRAAGRATPGVGPEAFVRLLPPLGGGSAHLVWELLGERPERGRVVRIAPIDAGGRLGDERAELAIASETVLPEIVPTLHGLAALTLAPACPRTRAASEAVRAELGACDEAAMPLFVAFDRGLRVTAAEPLRLDVPGHPTAEAAWGLSCAAQGCLTLAALSGAPAPIYAVDLEARSDRWLPPAATLPPVVPPRALAVRTIATAAPLADVATADLASGSLGAWVTFFDPGAPWVVPKTPAPDGRFAPLRALLQVGRTDADPPNATTISIRARSLGGVALAPVKGSEEALLVWTAIDQGRPQVFGTTVGGRGQKLTQKMLTTTAGEKSDVAGVWVGNGWVVGWIDERDGDAKPYVMRLDRTLRRAGNEQPLTTVAGAASGIALAPLGEQVMVVWADARDPAAPGVADLFGTRVSARDVTPAGEPQRLAATPAHSFSPTLAATEAGLVLAWLEASDSISGRTGAVSLAELDGSGRFAGPATRVEIAEGSPTGVALRCGDTVCRVAVGIDTGTVAAIDGFSWSRRSRPTPRRLTPIGGPSGQAVPLAFAGDDLLFGEQVGADRGRVHAVRIEW
ncbi:MAG: hypothetical protein JW751_07520 [Polyangiaceae bacterium]|nr:hypothetical protein [Polyangiaceae bacterium]